MMIARKLEHDDLDTRVEWFNNPLVYRQMVIDVPLSLASTQQWFSKAALDPSRRDFTFFEENEGHDEKLVALGGLTDIDHRQRNAELYIVVDPSKTGQGIGSRCVQWLCNYGFIQQCLEKVYLYTFDENIGARKVYSRCGFQEEGVLRKHILYQGRFVDRHIQSILKEDWLQQPWAVARNLSLIIE